MSKASAPRFHQSNGSTARAEPSRRSGNTHGFCVTGGLPPIASEPTPSPRLWTTPPGATPAKLCEHYHRVQQLDPKTGTFYLAGNRIFLFGSDTVLALAFIVFAGVAQSAGKLPLGKIPPGKSVLVVHPHHDDQTHNARCAGLIVKLIENGYSGNYMWVSNDEKDGPHGGGGNDVVNYTETIDTNRTLGLKEVISLNWRKDYTDPTPHAKLRAQLILLIRKYRPHAILARDPWARYDRNPDHRKVEWAVADAHWMAGYAKAS